MQRAIIKPVEFTEHIVSPLVLGHNLELFDRAATALVTNRLVNPKFAGPPEPATGLAPSWLPPTSNYMGIHYEWVAGEGILGSAAQVMQSTSNRAGKGLVQPDRWIRRGERLEIEIWARAIHAPVTIRTGIRQAAPWSADYASASLTIDSAAWQPYSASIEAPADDDAAVFFLWLEEPGLLAVDQVHLRPSGTGPVRRDVLETLGAFGMPLLRFPGGCLTTAYHWRYGTGPHHSRPIMPDPVFKRHITYEFGTDEFLEFCLEFDIVPVITINLGTGLPDEAAQWAAYCADWYRARGHTPPRMYWQLGNEQDGFWERSHMTGEMYGRAVRDLAPGLRQAYPAARLLALGVEQADRLDRGKAPWRKPLLEAAGELIDGLAFQLYAIQPLKEDPHEQHVSALQQADRHATTLRSALDDSRASGCPLSIALSEWNLWTRATHFAPEGFIEPMDMQHALFASAMFHHFMRLSPGLEFAAMYQIICSMGTFQVTGADIRPTLMADVFTLYRPALPGKRINVALTGPQLAPDLPMLDAAATATPHGLWLFLANRALDRPRSVTLDGWPVFGEGTTLAAGLPGDLQAPPEPARLTTSGVELPPLSLTRLFAPCPPKDQAHVTRT